MRDTLVVLVIPGLLDDKVGNLMQFYWSYHLLHLAYLTYIGPGESEEGLHSYQQITHRLKQIIDPDSSLFYSIMWIYRYWVRSQAFLVQALGWHLDLPVVDQLGLSVLNSNKVWSRQLSRLLIWIVLSENNNPPPQKKRGRELATQRRGRLRGQL